MAAERVMPKHPGEGVEPHLAEDDWFWNGTRWIDVSNALSLPQSTQGGGILGKTMLGISPDQLISGVQKGPSPAVAQQRELADQAKEQAIQLREDEQRARHIANRDFRVEADKDAATRAAAEFGQTMAQTSGAAGGGAAVLNAMNVKDPEATLQQHMARGDEQQLRAQHTAQQAAHAEQQETQRRLAADELERIEREQSQQQLAQHALTTRQGRRGDDGGGDGRPGQIPEDEPEDFTPAMRVRAGFQGVTSALLSDIVRGMNMSFDQIYNKLREIQHIGEWGDIQGIADWDAFAGRINAIARASTNLGGWEGLATYIDSRQPACEWRFRNDPVGYQRCMNTYDPRFQQGNIPNSMDFDRMQELALRRTAEQQARQTGTQPTQPIRPTQIQQASPAPIPRQQVQRRRGPPSDDRVKNIIKAVSRRY